MSGFKSFYNGKKVLVTGHTGFKGSWLSLWLSLMGAEVFGCALEPETNPSMSNVLNLENLVHGRICDIRNPKDVKQLFDDFKPEIVFHLAAQPIVRLSYKNPVLTYETNVLGTLNVLEEARKAGSVKSFVNVTTDKCYENMEESRGYHEDEPMGGYDMYSSSKGCVEIMSSSYRRCFLNKGQDGAFPMATARAGNVIGGGDWACDRLVPDCVKALNQGETIEIRSPEAIRPWQHVLEPLSGYLLLGRLLYEDGYNYAQGFNFGPDENSALSVEDIVKKVINVWGKGDFIVNKTDNLHEAKLLMLNTDKAKSVLGWKPVYDADKAVLSTIEWYKKYYENEPVFDYTAAQIKDYEEKIGGKTAP